MELNFKFRNNPQREFYYSTARNQCFSGGFNNGKTHSGVLKALTLLLMFNNYRMIISRQKYIDLRRTTMQTFLKMIPTELIESHNEQEGLTNLKNSSLIYWMHLDHVDENSLRGIEPNSILVDQAEETEEKVFDVLDSRLGRWDGAIIPEALLAKTPNWPISPTGRLIAPSYFMLLCNPDTEFHYIYRKFHPDSKERIPGYFYVEGEWDKDLGSAETYDNALRRDAEWVDKYVKGKWGTSSSAIHRITHDSLLDYTPTLLAKIKEKGNLFRSLDHGDSAPTCCLWFAALNGVYICYREYYTAARTISYHRSAITDLSEDEHYSCSYADPSIFHKASQRDGGFWSVADEYRTRDIDAPIMMWVAADNNEFATRNRINELLVPSSRFRHPITGESPAPGLYFIQASEQYPHGCKESIRQLGAQRKKLLGTIEGKSIYSDDRDEAIVDHAYDPTRYFVAMHSSQPSKHHKAPPRNSFAYYNRMLEMARIRGPVAASIEV